MAKKKVIHSDYAFLIVNHSRKTYTLSNSGYCYRLSGKDGREVTEPGEKFIIYGKNTVRPKLQKGYEKQILHKSIR